MKKILIIALILACGISLVMTGYAYAVYTVTYTGIDAENFIFLRQQVTDENGDTSMQVVLSGNHTLFNAEGDRKGVNEIYALTAQQQTNSVNFFKPFMQSTAAKYDIPVPAWAQ